MSKCDFNKVTLQLYKNTYVEPRRMENRMEVKTLIAKPADCFRSSHLDVFCILIHPRVTASDYLLLNHVTVTRNIGHLIFPFNNHKMNVVY